MSGLTGMASCRDVRVWLEDGTDTGLAVEDAALGGLLQIRGLVTIGKNAFVCDNSGCVEQWLRRGGGADHLQVLLGVGYPGDSSGCSGKQRGAVC